MAVFGFINVLLFVFGVVPVKGVTFNETQAVHERLISFYSNNNKSLSSIIPIPDLSSPITVQITLCLYSLDGFDAVTGQVDISASLYMEWMDETFKSEIGGYSFSGFPIGYSVTISPDLIWTPSLVLLNAVDGVKNVGDSSYKVRYLVEDGRSKWQPRAVVKASCRPNVKYYPFDRQDCSFTYTAWGYTRQEVLLEKAQSDWYLCDFTANAMWSLISTSAEEYIKNDQYYITFKFTIERQPMYFVINVIFPIILLAFLDGFVFLLPADSGERIGFCVTCALSFMFMLQTVLDILPQTAEPMSIICFYIVIMMVASMAQCVFTVLILRIYHKPEGAKVPTSIQRVVTVVTFAWVVPIFNRCKKICKKGVTSHKDDDVKLEKQGNPTPLKDIDDTTSFFGMNATGGLPSNTLNRKTLSSMKDSLKIENDNQSDVHFGGPPLPTKVALRSPVVSASTPIKRTASVQIRVASKNTGAEQFEDFDFNKKNVEDPDDAQGEESNEVKEQDSTKIKEVKWADVGKSLDTFLFFAFTGFQLAFTILYIIPMSSSSS